MVIEIGGLAIDVRTADPVFPDMLRARYGGFEGSAAEIVLDVEIVGQPNSDCDLEVRLGGGIWKIDRGDFQATYDPLRRRGHVRQTANPWSIDALIRIVHTLELALTQNGFLIHAASAIRNGRAFLFAGVSGAGKTTISRLAPADTTFLTDEISYVTRSDEGFRAFGTPFAGELGKPGGNVSAPVAALHFLTQARSDRLVKMPRAQALQCLMKNILFFADDAELVQRVFEVAAEFLDTIPALRLEFQPSAAVWSLIE